MKALVGTFNQEKALVGAFSVITNLRVDLRFKLYYKDLARVTAVRVLLSPRTAAEWEDLSI